MVTVDLDNWVAIQILLLVLVHCKGWSYLDIIGQTSATPKLAYTVVTTASCIGLCNNETGLQMNLHWTGKPYTVTTLSIIVDYLRVSMQYNSLYMSWLSGKAETNQFSLLLSYLNYLPALFSTLLYVKKFVAAWCSNHVLLY